MMAGFSILALLLLLAFDRSFGCLTGINGLPGISGFFPFGNNQQPGIPAGIPSPQIPSPNGQSLPGQAAQVGGVGAGTNGVPNLGTIPQLPSQIGQPNTSGQNGIAGNPGTGTNGLPSSNTVGKRESGFFPFGNSQPSGQRGILLPPLRQTSSDDISPQNGQAGGTNGVPSLPSLSAIQKRESGFNPFGNNQQENSGMPTFPNFGQNNGGLPSIGNSGSFGSGFAGNGGSTGGFPFVNNGRGSSNGGFQFHGMGGSNQRGFLGAFPDSTKSNSNESPDSD